MSDEEKLKLLLAFVKKLAEKYDDRYWYQDNTAYDLPVEAKDLLKELGFEND